MNREEFQKLYHQEVLRRNKEPYHFQVDEEADDIVEAYNPLCGDKFNLYLHESKSVFKSAYFHGFGCALSKSSTSLLMEILEGKSKEQIEELCLKFLEAVDTGNADLLENEELKVFAEMKNFDGRLDCIKLSWQAMLDHIKKKS